MTVAELKAFLVDEYGCNADEITAKSSFRSLGLDSLEITDLLMELEERTGIEIPDDDAQKLLTLQDAIDYITHTRSN